MEKSLLIYSTVDGQTEAICKRMASCAKNTNVDVMSISNVRNLNDYKVLRSKRSVEFVIS